LDFRAKREEADDGIIDYSWKERERERDREL
jgi:hypothetical protein